MPSGWQQTRGSGAEGMTSVVRRGFKRAGVPGFPAVRRGRAAGHVMLRARLTPRAGVGRAVRTRLTRLARPGGKAALPGTRPAAPRFPG